MARTPNFKLPEELSNSNKSFGKRNINAQVNVNLYNTVKVIAESEGKNMTNIIAELFENYIKENRSKAEELTNFKFS